METITNSEMFERVARREISPREAARILIERDDLARRQQVFAARPRWMPRWAWGVASVVIVGVLDHLQRRS